MGADYHASLKLPQNESTLRFHVFIDKCVLEIYVNGIACFTRAIYSPPEDLGLAVFADGPCPLIKSIDVWEMKSVW